MSRLLVLAALIMAMALALPNGTEATSLNELKKLTDSNGQSFDTFGAGVAVSGDTAVVGAYLEDTEGADAGAAFIYQRDQGGAGNWGEVTKLATTGALSVDDGFGFSVAISADTAIVAASGDGGFGGDAAYIFERDQGGTDNWGQVKKLTASDATQDNFFGYSVAVSGNTAIVGARRADPSSAGAVYIFQRNEGGADNWGQVKKLTASDAQTSDLFGSNVGISGGIAVVGAPFEDTEGDQTGAAYIFERDQGGAGNWGEVAKRTDSGGEAAGGFGWSVDVSGNTAVVGASNELAGVRPAGSALIFNRDQGGAGNWGEVVRLTASVPRLADRFGTSVAISGDGIVVGAVADPAFVDGVANVFQRDEGGADNWGQVSTMAASDAQAGDSFARGVGVSGDTAIVGAQFEAGQGAAYVFGLLQPKPTPTPCAPEGCPTPTATPVPGAEPEMRLLVLEPANACSGTKCQIGTGETFKLGVEIVRAPDDGYILAQTFVFYGSDITYDSSPSAADEIVWPDCNPATAIKSQIDRRLPAPPPGVFINSTELVSHGCLTGVLPPPPPSAFAGLYVEIDLVCSPQESSNLIELLPYIDGNPLPPGTIAGTSGALFTLPNNDPLVPLLSNLTVNCVQPAAVGGIAVDSGLRPLPLETAGPDSPPWGFAFGIVVAACLIAVGGATWYKRSRRLT